MVLTKQVHSRIIITGQVDKDIIILVKDNGKGDTGKS